MSSVTQRIKEIKQPQGGYVRPKDFRVTQLEDGKFLAEDENIHASLVGMAVDYLTRFQMGTPKEEAFAVSLLGAHIAHMRARARLSTLSTEKEAASYLGYINKRLSDMCIVSACKLVSFDVWYRNPFDAPSVKTAQEIEPDQATIGNIRIMVERSLKFWNQYGPIVKDGFTFDPRGYTDTVTTGDGDFLTLDTLWDFKVSKAERLTSKQTLQLLMYWIMGQHSGRAEFPSIRNLGVFNPRHNRVYLLDVNEISYKTIQVVEREVIGYTY